MYLQFFAASLAFGQIIDPNPVESRLWESDRIALDYPNRTEPFMFSVPYN